MQKKENLNRVMETKTISKNGRNPKNLMSRRKFSFILIALLTFGMSAFAQGGAAIEVETYETSTANVITVTYSGCKFVNWTINGTVVSTDNSYIFTVTEDVEIVVNFSESDVDIVETDNYPSLQIYPNPVNEQLTIDNGVAGQARNDVTIENVQIFDVMGRCVAIVETGRAPSLQTTSPETIINVSHLSPGVYFLRIGEKTAKFVKE